jgi:glyoxylase-like metal-dependent hydrolase (beta-lactamase superfamily II)
MVNIEEVAEQTYRIEVLLPKVDTIFAVYFIHGTKGIVIEPGPAATVPSIQEVMKRLGMKELAYIIPTHIHIDHAGAIGSLARLFPYAKVVLHPAGAKHAIDPSRLIESTKMAFGDDFENYYGPVLPVPESQVIVSEDEETIFIDDRELQVIYAPGHAPHHMAIFDQKTRGLFCGEALGLPRTEAKSSPLPAAAPPSFDIEVYLATMERLKELHPRILFYSHDGTGINPEELISKAAENTKGFGDIILEALRKEEPTEVIEDRVREYISRHLGINSEGMDVGMTIRGFISYFRKKGLV